MNWVITIPKTIYWEDYKLELKAVESGRRNINYRVRYIPKEMKVGDKMFIVHDGKVRGYMKVTAFGEKPGFTCMSTGIRWPAGNYIERSGKFTYIEPINMVGFRGIRKFDLPFKVLDI